MGDSRLRELERRWRETGAVEDEAAYLRERLRVGDLTHERLQLAAYCEHQAARLALSHSLEHHGTSSITSLDSLRNWADEISTWWGEHWRFLALLHALEPLRGSLTEEALRGTTEKSWIARQRHIDPTAPKAFLVALERSFNGVAREGELAAAADRISEYWLSSSIFEGQGHALTAASYAAQSALDPKRLGLAIAAAAHAARGEIETWWRNYKTRLSTDILATCSLGPDQGLNADLAG